MAGRGHSTRAFFAPARGAFPPFRNAWTIRSSAPDPLLVRLEDRQELPERRRQPPQDRDLGRDRPLGAEVELLLARLEATEVMPRRLDERPRLLGHIHPV